MSLIRRITATVSSRVDQAVSKVENHDAIVEAALRDTRQAAVRARVRLQRLQRDGHKLKQRQHALERTAGQWAERARTIAATDEDKALECLRRRRDCESQRRALDAAIANHDALEQRIAEQLRDIERRVDEVTQQRNAMRSRQSVADALRAIEQMDGSSRLDIEETFDRWEIHLGESEILTSAIAPADPLESAFLAEEDEAELRLELDALLKGGEAGDA